MKALSPFKTILLSTLFTLTSHSMAFAANGGSGPGGGYKYEFTVYSHIKAAQWTIEESLKAMNQNELDSIAAPFTAEKMEKQKLLKYLYSIDYAELDNGVRSGTGRVRDMDFSFENGGRIIALGPFFEYFHQKVLDKRDEAILRRKLLHEISHLFKIGIEDNDQSVKFAAKLETELRKIINNCGGSGTLEQRITNCQMMGYYRGEEKFGKVVMNYRSERLTNSKYALPSIRIHDGLSMFCYFVVSISDVNLKQDDGTYRTAEKICSLVNTLDGQIVWRALTADEVEKIDPVKNNSDQPSEVAIAKGQVRYINRGGLFSSDEGHITEITNTKRIYRAEGMQVYCFGSLK